MASLVADRRRSLWSTARSLERRCYPEAAKFSVDNGHRTADSGTSWNLFPDIAKAYGLLCRQSSNIANVKKALATGALVITSMKGGGHFTRSGHFIVLTGAHDGLIDVMDPNHNNDNYRRDGLIVEGVKNDGRVSAKESVFISEARSYWIFTYKREEAKPKMSTEDANKIIKFLQAAYGSTTDPEARAEFHRLANELRKVSGQPVQ